MKDKIKFNTEGNAKAVERAQMGADMNTPSGAQWLASQLQLEHEKREFGMRFTSMVEVES